jgi:hypothetical protein
MIEPVTKIVAGHEVLIHPMGQISVRHDGHIAWETLQQIKSAVWGPEARAIEVYPADSQIVNNVFARHLWLLGKDDFCPDLLGDAHFPDTLESRYRRAWQPAYDATNPEGERT